MGGAGLMDEGGVDGGAAACMHRLQEPMQEAGKD